jgi:hypothetical protein
MRLLYVQLLVAVAAHASLVGLVTAETGIPGFTPVATCQETYTAPVGSPFFDRSCAAPNSAVPSRPAYAEVAASSPMHLFLETIGGWSAVGCTPTDGCPGSFAQINYNDVWTVTGGTGPGEALLHFTSGGMPIGGTVFTSVQGNFSPGTPSDVFIPFVFGQPFTFSLRVDLYNPVDTFYGTSTYSLNGTASFFQGTCSDLLSCLALPRVDASVTAGVGGDPFVPTPEPATAVVGTWLVAGLMYRKRVV